MGCWRGSIKIIRLPNADQALVDIVKLRDYCLSNEHPEGRHKARVFLSALGMGSADAEKLQAILLSAAKQNEALATTLDEYGQRYVVDATVQQGGREAVIRSSWMIRKGENFPRLTSCFVL